MNKSFALDNAARIASASAIRGEETELQDAEYLFESAWFVEEKVQPSPAALRSFLQAASVLQVVIVRLPARGTEIHEAGFLT